MHGERLYETTRGLTLFVAAGVAGLLLWVATEIGTQTEGRYWAAMGIVAGAGLVVSLAPVVAAWTKGLHLRISTGTFLFAFLPALVCVVWILLTTAPVGAFARSDLISWSRWLGILGLIHDLALWHGVLAFGLGLVLGLSWDAVPRVAPAAPGPPPAAEEPLPADEQVTAVHEPPAERDPSLPGGIMSGSRSSR